MIRVAVRDCHQHRLMVLNLEAISISEIFAAQALEVIEDRGCIPRKHASAKRPRSDDLIWWTDRGEPSLKSIFTHVGLESRRCYKSRVAGVMTSS